MCGISGCVSEGTSIKSIIDSLNKLQNRGYDSVGICAFDSNNNTIMKKYVSDQNTNAMESLNKEICTNIISNLAIGHTRWATHGPKTLENAHPHYDETNKYIVVHNGIIENYAELKNELLEKNYTFYGQTDSEVIAKYLHYVNGDIEQLSKILLGSWAVLILDTSNKNRIYYMKNGSPLIVGFSKLNEKIMLVSEFVGFDCNISTYSVICDGDYGYIENDIVSLTNQTYTKIIMPDIKCELTPAPYSHWTLKEIHEQSNALTKLLCCRIDNFNINFPELSSIDFTQVDHMIFLACGTSYHAAQIGVKFFRELYTRNITFDVIDGADFEDIDIPRGRKTVLVLLSQSGETKDLYRALVLSKSITDIVSTVGIINVENSLIAREVDVVLYLKAGREHAVASTKSFTNQVTMLLLLALWINRTNPIIDDTTRINYLSAIKKLPIEFNQIVKQSIEEIPKHVIKLFENQDHCFILGKQVGEWIAKEASLKIKEISYIHAEGYSAAALKHGPFALISPNTPIILIGTNDRFYSKIDNVTSEVKSRFATVIHITNKPVKNDNIDYIFYYKTESLLFPILAIAPLQILSYYLALGRCNNPDYPRNLAKVVTVE